MKKWLSLTMAVLVVGWMAYATQARAEAAGGNDGLAVTDSKGEYVGTVRNALIDQNGKIAFVIVSVGDESEAKKDVAAPLTIFSFDQEKGSLVSNIDKETFAQAPAFADSDLGDPGFPERIYRFFGLMPAWSEPESGVRL